MHRLLVIMLLAIGFLLLPAVALAQDEPTAVVVEDGALPPNVEDSGEAVGNADDLDAISSLEYWHLLAAALPIAIGHVGNALGIRSAAGKARLSLVAYLGYAVFGELLKGSFDTLSWDTPQLVMASAIKVAGISYAAYKIVANAKPGMVGGAPGPSG